MTLALTQTLTAIGPGLTSSFLGVGGTGALTYSVLPDGAGGSIDSDGIYTAPENVSSDIKHSYDTIQVEDSLAAIATSRILVGLPLNLVCEIIQNQMNLANGRVYLWDQKIMQPSDSGLYIAVREAYCKPFANVNDFDGSAANQDQFISMWGMIDFDLISRDSSARDRKAELLIALNSQYSRQQQDANSFSMATIPLNGRFINLSILDGAAIPYRFRISLAMQYFAAITTPISYFNDFTDEVVINA